MCFNILASEEESLVALDGEKSVSVSDKPTKVIASRTASKWWDYYVHIHLILSIKLYFNISASVEENLATSNGEKSVSNPTSEEKRTVSNREKNQPNKNCAREKKKGIN